MNAAMHFSPKRCGGLRRRVAVEEVERDGRVDIGEDRGGPGPELVEQPAQLVRERDTLTDEVIAQAAEVAEGFGLVGQRRKRVWSEVRSKRVRMLPLGGKVERGEHGTRDRDRRGDRSSQATVAGYSLASAASSSATTRRATHRRRLAPRQRGWHITNAALSS